MTNDLTEGNITSQIKTIAIPASIGFFFSTMFNIVDAYFGGKLGDAALAGLTASFPAFFIIVAASSGISTATTALIANHLGKRDPEGAKSFYVQGIFFGIIAGIFLTIIGLAFGRPVLELMGLTPEVVNYGIDYLNIIFLGTPFFILVSVLNSYLNAQGKTKIFRNLLIVGFFLNVIFDPWFLYGGLGVPAMGIQGVAFATVLVQVFQCIYLAYYLKKEGVLSGKIQNFTLKFRILKQIATLAAPASLDMMNIAIGSFLISSYVASFGADAIAAYGVAIRIEQIALIPTIGLHIATLAIIGQSNGAQKFDRIRKTMRTSIKLALYVLLFAIIITTLFGRTLFEQFTENQNIISIGMSYLYIALGIFMAYVISFIGDATLQGIKQPAKSFALGLTRQIILPLIVFPIVIKYFGFGITALWFSIFGINWTVSLIIFYVANRSIHNKEKEIII